MATPYASIDAVEQDLASAELDELALSHDSRPWDTWKEAVLEWHLRALATARAEAWIPGLAESRDQVVERALERFYSHHMRNAISRLRAENMELRRKMLEVAECARFYASGATDAGKRAGSMLSVLCLPPARKAVESRFGASH
jgi:inorganic triphosphatase YgiF